MKTKATYMACLSWAVLLFTSTVLSAQSQETQRLQDVLGERAQGALSTESRNDREDDSNLRRRRLTFERQAASRERKDLIDQVRGAANQESFDRWNTNPRYAVPHVMPQTLSPTFNGDQVQWNTADMNGLARVPNWPNSKLMKINNQISKEISELIGQIKNSKDDQQKKELKEQLAELLSKQYDAYLDHHEEPLKKLEARLEKLREDFDARKSAKADLVKLRLDTIWYDAIGLGWPGNSGNNSSWNLSQPRVAVPYQNQFQQRSTQARNSQFRNEPLAPQKTAPLEREPLTRNEEEDR